MAMKVSKSKRKIC